MYIAILYMGLLLHDSYTRETTDSAYTCTSITLATSDTRCIVLGHLMLHNRPPSDAESGNSSGSKRDQVTH